MMRHTASWLLIGAIGLLPEATPGYAAPASQAPEPLQAAEPTTITGLELEGALKAVDPDKSLFLVMDTDGTERLFFYDDRTEVEDHTAGVQGLSTQTGTWLRIAYRAEGTRAIAERIAMVSLGGDGRSEGPVEPEPTPSR